MNITTSRKIRKMITGSYFTKTERDDAYRKVIIMKEEAALWAGTPRAIREDKETLELTIDELINKELNKFFR